MVHLFRGLSSEPAGCDGQPLGIESMEVTAGPPDHDGTTNCAGSVVIDGRDGSFTRQALFAACTWVFWLAFVASTIGRAPKEVRCVFGAAAVSPLSKSADLAGRLVWTLAAGVTISRSWQDMHFRMNNPDNKCLGRDGKAGGGDRFDIVLFEWIFFGTRCGSGHSQGRNNPRAAGSHCSVRIFMPANLS